jgi:hypothetical protein
MPNGRNRLRGRRISACFAFDGVDGGAAPLAVLEGVTRATLDELRAESRLAADLPQPNGGGLSAFELAVRARQT